MEIVWLGHACVRIRAREATIVADPCDKSTGYSLGRPTADIVTVSVDDPAHNYAAGVAGQPRILSGPGEYEIAGASVAGVATWHDRQAKATGPRNVVFVYDLEDLRVCHLGAIGTVPTSDQLEQIGSVDILLVPVGGADSLDAPAASEAVSLIEPRLVIPVHYATDIERTKLDSVDRFLKEMGAKPGERHAKLAVTRSSLPEETQVIVLDYKR
jgi:L-ascorbate metabolism protein UlaG (beta-lactamase superfamily)